MSECRGNFPALICWQDASHPEVQRSLTAEDQLPCHEERGGACGAVVVDVDDGDASQAQAVINGSLPTRRVAWWKKRRNLTEQELRRATE